MLGIMAWPDRENVGITRIIETGIVVIIFHGDG
jgi:hypothetical protein